MVDYEKYWNLNNPAPQNDPLHPAKANLLRHLLTPLPISLPHHRVLELGGGALHHWTFVPEYIRHQVSLVNVELSDAASDHIPLGLIDSFADYARVRTVHEAGEGFHFLASFEVLEHINPVRATVDALRSASSQRAIWVGTVPYHGFLKNLLLSTKWDLHFPIDNEHVQFFSKNTLRCLIEDSGWKVQKLGHLGRIPPIAKSMYWIAEPVQNTTSA